MSRLAVAPRLSAPPDAGAAITALDELLVERAKQAAVVADLSTQVHRARVAFDAAEVSERRAEGAEGFGAAVAATQAARDELAAAARAMTPAKTTLQDLDGRITAGWRAVSDATRPAHLAAEAAAEADIRAAAAQVGHAARRLNDIRRALGSPLFPRLIIRDPADATLNAADVSSAPDSAANEPLIEEITRLRTEVESLRGR